MFSSLVILGIIAALVLFATLVGISALFLRRVVPTNEVHILQRGRNATSYGMGKPGGNVYYLWPSWFPVIGLSRTVFPVSVFDLSFDDYEAYDKERVPFVVDITAFFRVSDSNVAAERVASFDELRQQLLAIVQGAVRTVLASEEIDKIMLERSVFGERFTAEVTPQLVQWGVESVKNIELMDIRDTAGSQVIHNIMAKRTSAIEKDSRVVVAENQRAAKTAEIAAQRDVDLQKQDAEQKVGQRTAEKDKAVGIANEQSQQEILTQNRETKQREMAVAEVQNVRAAEITKSVNLVRADEKRQTEVIVAEGERQKTVITAEGELEAERRRAAGIEAVGLANAAAEKAIQLAPVEAQIVLAKEIGGNQGYQAYLIGVRQIEATQVIGVAQAKALEEAGIKIIANTGDNLGTGINSVTELFSPKGGLALGGMLEGLRNTETGKEVLDKVVHKDTPVDA